jgi:hypothetical protein
VEKLRYGAIGTARAHPSRQVVEALPGVRKVTETAALTDQVRIRKTHGEKPGIVDDPEEFLAAAVHELGPELHGQRPARRSLRVHAPSETRSAFEQQHRASGFDELGRGRQARRAASDDDHVPTLHGFTA